jgi:hypothetical protein
MQTGRRFDWRDSASLNPDNERQQKRSAKTNQQKVGVDSAKLMAAIDDNTNS